MMGNPMPDFGRPAPTTAPGVVLWAKIYAWSFVAMYLFCTIGGIFMLVAGEALGGGGDREQEKAMIQAVAMTAVGPPLMILSAIAALAPRKKWGWIVNIIVMGLGCTSCCCLPAAIPLLIFWLKQDTRQWYGV